MNFFLFTIVPTILIIGFIAEWAVRLFRMRKNLKTDSRPIKKVTFYGSLLLFCLLIVLVVVGIGLVVLGINL